jgi:hypothetical protein
MSTGMIVPAKDKIKTKQKSSFTPLNRNPSTSMTTTSSDMDKISQTILKSAMEAILLLTLDNYTLWRNQVENVLDLQELFNRLTSPNRTLTKSQDVQLRTILTSKLDTSIQANVIDHTNQKDAQKIWKSITNHFASSKASNHAQVFKELLLL